MSQLLDALAGIGLMFIVFSAITIEEYLRNGEERGKAVAWTLMAGMWILIGFGVGSWLISSLYHLVLP